MAPDAVDLGTDKPYFKIGEVADIVGVAPSVLRYWETEFRIVRPTKSRTQQRVYRRSDVVNLLRIKHLLYEERFTIAGARQKLEEGPARCVAAAPSGLYLARLSLARVRTILDEARALTARAADVEERIGADPAAFVAAQGGVRALLEEHASGRGVAHRDQRRPR